MRKGWFQVANTGKGRTAKWTVAAAPATITKKPRSNRGHSRGGGRAATVLNSPVRTNRGATTGTGLAWGNGKGAEGVSRVGSAGIEPVDRRGATGSGGRNDVASAGGIALPAVTGPTAAPGYAA